MQEFEDLPSYLQNVDYLAWLDGPPVFLQPLPTSTEVYDWAAFYLAQGWSVIPLAERDKKPACSWREYQTRLPTLVELKKWFPQGTKRNIGIVTGSISGINVIDCDTADAYQDLMKMDPVISPLVKTARGFHLYCRGAHGATNFTGRPGLEKVDFRGEGGYVVAPPSTHPAGVQYQWLPGSEHIALSEVPSWILEGKLPLPLPLELAPSTMTLPNKVGFDYSNYEIPPEAIDTRQVKDALQFIPADNYKTWIDVGLALFNDLGEAGLDLYRDWSRRSEKYNEDELMAKWDSFATPYEGTKVSIGTIFHRAKAAGWCPPSSEKARVLEGEPLPLRRVIPPGSVFPVDALPPVLGNLVAEVISTVQVPPALAGQSALAAAALAVQGLADVTVDGRTYALSEFFLTIAESGERKTSSDRVFLKPFQDYQRILASLAVSQREQYAVQQQIWKQQRENAVKAAGKSKTPVNLQAIIAQIGPEPNPPASPTLLVEEPTYEGLIKVLDTGLPSVGLFSDEGGRFLGGHAMGKDNLLKTIAGISKLWDGDPITRTRSGEGHTLLYGRRCALHLMIQPSVMGGLFGSEVVSGQGFLSRCLSSFPISTIGCRTYRNKNVYASVAFAEYMKKITAILNQSLSLNIDPILGLKTQVLNLSPEGKVLWVNFINMIEQEMKEEGKYRGIRGLASKAGEHVVRLAAIMTCVEDSSATMVAASAISSAIKLVTYYLDEGVRLCQPGSENPDLQLAERCLEWARKNDGVIELTKLYQRGPNPLRSKDKALQIIKILDDHGWLERLEGGMTIDGRQHQHVWQLRTCC